MLREKFEETVRRVVSACHVVYGEQLVTLAVYGSVGRGTPNPCSDIDLLIVASQLPRGRLARSQSFERVEEQLEPWFDELRRDHSISAHLSPVIKTPEEVLAGSWLFLDMISDARILFDRDGFFEDYLRALRRKLDRLGARKIRRGQRWHWVLKPDCDLGDAESYLHRAKLRLRVLDLLLKEESYSDVVCEAQETVELSLKGILRAIGVEPPKQHDVGYLVVEYSDELPSRVAEKARELARISKWLRKEREFALYGDVDFIPSSEYSLDDARRARTDARTVVEAAELVIG